MDKTTDSHNAMEDEILRYKSYLKTDPENAHLWISLGDLYHQSGNFEEARNCFEKCSHFDENNMVARSRLANVMISLHRFSDAEDILKEIVVKTGDDPALLHNLGLSQFYQHHFKEAHQTFMRAQELGLNVPKNLAYLVYSLHNNNDTGKALEFAQTWLQESPGPATEGYISMVEMDHGDMEAARLRAEKVLQQQSDNADANLVIGTWNMEQQNAERAENCFLQMIRSEPDNPRGWQGLGLVKMYQQNYQEAFRALEQARSLMPENATIHLVIGWAYLGNQDAKAAETNFRKAIAADHNFGEAHGGLACALVFQNRQEEARIAIKKALALDPKGFGAVFGQSILMQLDGKGTQGTKLLAKLFEQQPLPRSKPIIEHIQDFVRKQKPVSAPASRTSPSPATKHSKNLEDNQ